MGDPWRDKLDSLPIDPPVDPGGPVLILSAHPDDEVIAVGGWLSTQADRPMVFVTATDGESSHPGSPTIQPEELRRRRPAELLEALRELGIPDPEVHRLGLPDGSLQAHQDALRQHLAPFIERASLVLAPFERDGHPDHDSLGSVALDLCGDTTPLWRFPIWTWAWTKPEGQEWLPLVRRLPCSPTARHLKTGAIKKFVTQVRPLSSHPADLAVVDDVLLRHAAVAPEGVLI